MSANSGPLFGSVAWPVAALGAVTAGDATVVTIVGVLVVALAGVIVVTMAGLPGASAQMESANTNPPTASTKAVAPSPIAPHFI